MISVELQTAVIRVVNESRGPYKGVANICWITPDTVFVYGMHGKFSISDLRELATNLRLLGVSTVIGVRNGRLVVHTVNKWIR